MMTKKMMMVVMIAHRHNSYQVTRATVVTVELRRGGPIVASSRVGWLVE